MNIFAYGILLFPELMHRVTGRRFRSTPARLRGFASFRIKKQSFPGLIPFPDHETEGAIYHDVDEHSLAKLDAFEGSWYYRRQVTVQDEDGGWVEAETYVMYPERAQHLSADHWDELDFRESGLAEFLRNGIGLERQPDRKDVGIEGTV